VDRVVVCLVQILVCLQNLAVPVVVVTVRPQVLAKEPLVKPFLAIVVDLVQILLAALVAAAVLTLLVQTQVALLAALVAQGKQTLSQARQ
jgi:hypothetical protein